MLPATPTEEIKIVYLPLSVLLAWRWENNPKLHQETILGHSITNYGFDDPVGVCVRHTLVLEGHGRLEFLERQQASGQPAPRHIKVSADGVEWGVPTVNVDFAERDQALLYALAHNRANTGQLTSKDYNQGKLTRALEEATRGQFALPGFGNEEVQGAFIGALEPPPLPSFDAPLSFATGGLAGTAPVNLPEGVAANLPSSHVRMVQLFFNMETQPRFLEMVNALGALWAIDNTSDAVWRAVEQAYLAAGLGTGPLPNQIGFDGRVVGMNGENSEPLPEDFIHNVVVQNFDTDIPLVPFDSPEAIVREPAAQPPLPSAATAPIQEPAWLHGLCKECGGSGHKLNFSLGMGGHVVCPACGGAGDEATWNARKAGEVVA